MNSEPDQQKTAMAPAPPPPQKRQSILSSIDQTLMRILASLQQSGIARFASLIVAIASFAILIITGWQFWWTLGR
jgi:hypothetical protein